jgi:hypothetical protein
MIAGVLGGPVAGQLTSLGLSTLAKFLGISDPNPSPETVLQAAQIAVADPAQKLLLVQAENDFTLKMKGLEIQEQAQQLEELKAELADVQNAREREVRQTEKTGSRDWNLYLLSYVLFGGFFFLTWYLMHNKLPDESSQVVFMLFGSLSTGFGSVIQYFFGSSKGSADKSMAMERTNVALADVAAKGKK